jgi:hypothetical protein
MGTGEAATPMLIFSPIFSAPVGGKRSTSLLLSVKHKGIHKVMSVGDNLNTFEEVKPRLEEPALLIFDGNNYHSKNLYIIDLGRRENVTVVCFPPHPTNKYQPSDKSTIDAVEFYLKTKKHELSVGRRTLCKTFRHGGIFSFNHQEFRD